MLHSSCKENVLTRLQAKFLPRRGYCVGGFKNRCSSVRPSVSHEIDRSPESDLFCDHLRRLGEVKGLRADPSRSWWVNARVSMGFELFEVTCAGHVWTLLRNSP